jgi:arylsulfatase A-like enzyme/Tfp pilus assembly protein PilF
MVLAVSLGVVTLALAGCSRDPLSDLPTPGPIATPWLEADSPGGPYNLLLVTLDTTRRDRLGCCGDEQALTPNLDALAARGVLFEQAVAPTPVTLPSHATILTGLDPQEHGIRNNGTFVLDSSCVTIAELLRERGYATGAVLGAFPVEARFGLDQGFDSYDDDFPAESHVRAWQTAQRRADEVTRLALQWMEAHRGGPFFHWAHYFDPHFPYEPPQAYRDSGEHRYDGEVAFMDAQIGELIEGMRGLGLLERTWILLVGDHGESLGEHGEPGHSMLIYAATQYVPCILVPPESWQGLPSKRIRGRRVREVVRLCDLAPTALNALGFAQGISPGTGSSLLPLIAGTWEGPRVAYTETLVPFLEYGWSELRGVRSDRWCYIRAPEPELYDLHRDPAESQNLYGAFPEVAERLSAWCDFLVGEDSELQLQPIDPVTAERLRSLGYVASAAPRGPSVNEKDPKKLMPLFSQINEVRTALGFHRVREAKEKAQQVLDEDPGNPEATRLLGLALLRLGEGAAARKVYDELRTAFPDDLEMRVNRARAEILAGSLDEAEEDLRAVLAEQPRHGDARALYAQVLTQGGRAAEARQFLEAAFSDAPDSPELLVELARMEWSEGNAQRTQELATRALECDGTHSGALALLGECLWWQSEREVEAGRAESATRLLAEARAHLDRALSLDPTEPVAAFRVAWLIRREGNTQRAVELYERALVRRSEWPDLHVNLGNLLREIGRIDEALQHYEMALALGFEEVNFLVNYGVALVMKGRAPEALLTWERALEQAPDQRYADGIQRNIDMLRRGMNSGQSPAPR